MTLCCKRFHRSITLEEKKKRLMSRWHLHLAILAVCPRVVTDVLSRDVGYMRICDRICDRIFCQNPHIAYFSAYDGIFRIAYAKIMPHMQKIAYIRIYAAYFRICDRIFFIIFLVQRCFKTAKYFGGKRLPVGCN